jgi:hypothetical protein
MESMSDFIQRAAAPAFYRAPKKAKKTRSHRPHARADPNFAHEFGLNPTHYAGCIGLCGT